MSHTTANAAAASSQLGPQASLCGCNDVNCQQQLFLAVVKIGDNTIDRRQTVMSQCCGEVCNREADKSHYCVICNANVCGVCVIANYDGSEPEPWKVNVICDKHPDYCASHNLQMRHLEVPTAEGTNENRPSGWEENFDVGVELKNDADRKQQAIDLVKTATWKHVRASAAMINPLNKTGIDIEDPEKNTKLRGFVFDGIGLVKTQHISSTHLRKFCTKNSIASKMGADGKPIRPSKMTKKMAADEIAAKLPEYQLAAARGQGDTFISNASSGVEPHFNMKRFLNTLLGRAFAPKLLEIGARLDRNDLEGGLRTDESIFTFFLTQYNNQNENNASSFNIPNFGQDASKFTPFPEGEWLKAKKKYTTISSDYNAAFNSRHQSGSHKSFNELAVVQTQPWLGYLHCLLEERGDADALRSAIFSDLPSDVFSDSTNGPPPRNGRSGDRRGGGGNRDNGGRSSDERKRKSSSEDNALNSMAVKHRAQAALHTTQHKTHLQEQLAKHKKGKRESKTALLEAYDGDFDKRKEKIKAYNDFKNGPSGDDSDEEEAMFSQRTLLEQYYDANKYALESQAELKKLDEGNKE